MFHSKLFQYSTWCQNRGCSYISSIRRIYRSNPAVSCISSSILNKVELHSTNSSKKGGRSHPASSEQFYPAEYPFYTAARLSSSQYKAVQGPRVGSACFQCILPGRNFILCGSASPAGFPVIPVCVAVEEDFYINNSKQDKYLQYPFKY